MHRLCGGFAFTSGQRVLEMRWSWRLTARSTLASLEFGAVSMRFSAADAMFIWMCMFIGDEEVSPDLISEVVRSLCVVYLW